MFIVYNKYSGEVYSSFETFEYDSDGILYGYIGKDKVGYHPSCFPEIHELSNEELNVFDPLKQWLYRDGELIEKVAITSEDDINLMLTDQEYRLLMLELGM